MKQLMLGNAAVARGLYEAGCSVASSYPGTPSTEITEEAAKYDAIYCEWAPNEKVAMETAFGACLAGKRSFCGMKHVGLNVAADPLFTISYTGVNAGMVIAVADDAGMHSSQNEQDSRHYAIAAKVPMLEPSDSAEALAFAKRAYEISEEFDTPVILKMCTRVSHSQSLVELGERTEVEKPYEKNIAKYVMMPGNAIRRHPVVEERTRKLTEFAETCDLNRVEMGGTSMGVITSSTSYQYVKEVFGDSVSVLKLGMVNPLPVKLILDFASKVDKLVVVEELDSIIEDHCRKLGLKVWGKNVLPLEGEFSQNLVAAKLGGAAAFIDVEHALDPVYAKNLGVDIDNLYISQPDNGEQALEITETMVRSGAVDIIIVDSVAALVPKAEIDGDMGDSHVGLQARLMSQALRKLTAIISKSNCVVIFINQLREKVGVMFGNPETTTGGRALKFYSSIRLDVRRVETLKQGGEMVGNHTRIKVVKNKVAPPFKQAEFDIMFGTGISKEGDILDLAAENSIVNKSGAWYAYEGNKIGQGRENAKLFLKEHPDICDEIERKVRIHYHLLPGEEEEQLDVKQEETTPESDAPAAEEE